MAYTSDFVKKNINKKEYQSDFTLSVTHPKQYKEKKFKEKNSRFGLSTRIMYEKAYENAKKQGKEDEFLSEYEEWYGKQEKISKLMEERGGPEKKVENWFSAGAFDDGYQFGDATKTVLSTAGDVGVNAIHGAGSTVEGVVDLGSYGVAGVYDFFGNEKQADKIRKKAKKDTVGEILEPTEEFFDKNSVIGEKGDQVSQGLGQVGVMIATGGAGSAAGLGAVGNTALTTGLTYTSSMGSGMSEAYQSGATDKEALTYGAIKGAGDAATELIFAGLGKTVNAKGFNVGLTSADDMLARKVSSKINNQIARNFVEFGIKAGAEGSEEVLAGVISAIGKKVTYMDEEEWGQIVKDEKLLDQFIVGAVTSGFAQSGVIPSMKKGSLIEANQTGRDFVTGYTQNEQTVLETEIENRIAEAEKNGKKLTNKEKNNIGKEVREDLEKGYISTDIIESTLDSDTYNKLKTQKEEVKSIEKQIKELQSKKMSELSVGEYNDATSKIRELQEKLKGIDTNTLETQLNDEMGQKISSDDFLKRSYQEKAQRGANFTYDSNEITNENEKAVYESAAKIMNNTRRSHEFVEKVAKIAKDKGTNYGFTNNAELKELGLNVDGKQVNGFVTTQDGKQTVLINVDSAKALNTIVGHETTHLLEGTQAYQELQDAIFNYAKQKGDFDSRQASLYSLYKDIKGADVNSELTADLVGDYLFTDTKFIESLSTQKPKVFQKIKELIDDLVVRFKGTKEEKQLREVQKKFREAYRQNSSNTNTDTKFSIGGIKAINSMPDSKFKHDAIKDYNKAKEMKESGEYTNEEIRQATKWFQDRNGAWKFEFTDEFMTLKDNVKLSKNSSYKLGDILKHDYLFTIYPELRGYNVEFQNKGKGKGGSYNESSHTITLNNSKLDLENPKQSIEGTLIHEIQHAIQNIEGFETGRPSILSKKAYYESLGEIEATDTRRRFDQKLTKEERKQIAPESSKADAKHPQYDNYMKNRGTIDKFKDNLYNFFSGGNTNAGKNQELDSQNPYENTGLVDGREGRGHVDSTSFFDGENTKYSLTDNQGRQLTKEQQEYFKDSKVKDENGNLLTMYHGTNNDFTIFENEFIGKNTNNEGIFGKGFYFTEKKSLADNYNRKEGKVAKDGSGKTMELYLDMKKPFYWNDIDTKEKMETFIEETGMPKYVLRWNNTLKNQMAPITDIKAERKFSEVLQKNGYDGVIYKYEDSVGEYVVFNSNQIKNVDNLKPTSDADIRYSLSDNKGRELTKEQQEYFKNSKVRDENGNLSTVYHGSDFAGFTEFGPKNGEGNYKYEGDTITFLTDSKSVANSYTKSSESVDTAKLNTIEDAENWLGTIGLDESIEVKSEHGLFYIEDIDNEETISTYNSEAELLRNFKRDIQNSHGDPKAGGIYEGYANITNPYVVDVKGNNWDEIAEGDNNTTIFIKEKMPQKIKDELIELAETSKQEYKRIHETEEKYSDVVRNLNEDDANVYRIFQHYPVEELSELVNRDYSVYNEDMYDDTERLLYTMYNNKLIERDDWYNFSYTDNHELSKEVQDKIKNLEKATIKDLDGNEITMFEFRTKHWNALVESRNNTYDRVYFERHLYNDYKDYIENEVGILLEGFAGKNYEAFESLYEIAESNFNEDVINQALGKHVTTNDIVKKILESNKNGETNYDGVIFKNIHDVGSYGTDYETRKERQNVYVTFNSNQFKAVDNSNPTSDADIRYSMSNQDDIAPVKDKNLTYGEDVKIDLPIREELNNLSNQVRELRNQLNKAAFGEATTQEEMENLSNIAPNDIAPIRNNLTAEESQELDILEALPFDLTENLQERADELSNKEIGEPVIETEGIDRDTPAFMKIDKNAALKPYFQAEAEIMLTELKDTIKGQRMIVGDTSQFGSANDQQYIGIKRQTSEDIARLLDGYGYSYSRIEAGLNRIIEDKSYSEASRTILNVLEDRLIDGYKTIEGYEIPANNEFISQLKDTQVSSYNDAAYQEWSNTFGELVKPEDILPVSSELKNIPKDPTKESSYDNEPESEFVKKQKREFKKLGTQSEYVSNKALELYEEIRNLKKGVKASNDLSYILDHDLDWKSVKTALLNIKAKPDTVVNSNSTAESTIREMLNNQYKTKYNEIKNMKEDLVTKTKRELRKELLIDENDFFINALDNAKNKSMALMNNTDTIRNTEIVFGRENGRKINELIFQKEIDNEADSIAWQNKERQEIKDLGIKARSKESAAVQKYGEKQWITENGEVKEYGDAELKAEFNDAKTRERIKNAAKVIREKYDFYIDEANTVLTQLGFDAIPKRKDYMRHFQELTDIFSRNGIPFNAQSMQEHVLPTDINGLTEFWSPQKNYFANAQHRTGMKTNYDAITGIDGYIGGIANLIYHTEDIQRGRAFEELIRDTYGEDKGWDNLENLPDLLKQERAAKIQDNHLSNYAAWVHEWTNNIAGKKNKLDRSVEATLGRKAFTVLDEVRKQVGANMIGFNLSSAGTNFVAPFQALAKTNKLAFVKGTADTIKNIFVKDNFMEKNRFLTSRMGTDMISKNAWQKIQDAGFIFMKGADWFTSNQIVRSKYYELRAKGVPEAQAHAEAGQFAARIMGDRTKGANPQLYNSKLIGLVTQFQLEVNNQLYSMFYDTYQDSKENAKNNALKTAAGMTFTLGQLAAFTHLFGKTFEAIAGYNPTLDIIEILKTAFGWGEDDEEKTTSERFKAAADQLVDALPYVNILTGGGRIPVASGIPNLVGVATGGKDEYGNELTLEGELKKLLYLIPPTGGNQIKKTTQGLGMFDEDLPVAGSYTDSGNLRYPVEDTPLNRVQAALFGQYANKNAGEYFDNERLPLKSKQIQEYADLDMPIADYWEYRDGLKEQKTTKEKFDYINSLDVTDEQKNIMINNALTREDRIDMSNYDDFGSYEEFDFATKNPEKYEFFEANGISYKDYSASEESKEAYNWAYNNQEKYQVTKQIDTFENYISYKNDIASIKEQFSTENGYSTAERKAAVQQYIESLNLGIPQKIMLEKMAGGYSIKNYKSYIVSYIESLPLTAEEKQAIHDELFN